MTDVSSYSVDGPGWLVPLDTPSLCSHWQIWQRISPWILHMHVLFVVLIVFTASLGVCHPASRARTAMGMSGYGQPKCPVHTVNITDAYYPLHRPPCHSSLCS